MTIGVLVFVYFWLPDLLVTQRLSNADDLKARNDIRLSGVQLVGGIALVIGFFLSARTFHLTRRGQTNERFSRAVDQLASERLAVREGRNAHAAAGECGCASRPRRVIEARLAARPVDRSLDLTNTDLRRVVLRNAHLERANLSGAHLDEALALGAPHFEHAQLIHAVADGAQLDGAYFTDARLLAASLRGAMLRNARLEGAELGEAHLEGADLTGARGASLRSAHTDAATLGP